MQHGIGSRKQLARSINRNGNHEKQEKGASNNEYEAGTGTETMKSKRKKRVTVNKKQDQE